jgi:hypothetical protein
LIKSLFLTDLSGRYDYRFSTETEDDHQDMGFNGIYVKYNFGYMYSYSEETGTLAWAQNGR